jgi:hypothetical protein
VEYYKVVYPHPDDCDALRLMQTQHLHRATAAADLEVQVPWNVKPLLNSTRDSTP